MISGIPKTRDPWILYYWFVNELKAQGYDEDFILGCLTKPDVPRGTCFNCKQAYPPQKVKHKEVFENVVWIAWPCTQTNSEYVIYPNIDINKKHYFMDKPSMKMTLEWEE